MAAVAELTEKLHAVLRGTKAFDDEIVETVQILLKYLYEGSGAEREAAGKALTEYRDYMSDYGQIQHLLTRTNDSNVHFYALSILQQGVKMKWSLLSETDRQALPSFLLRLARSAASGNTDQAVLTKVNQIIVNVAEKCWPHQWPTFISDLCESSTQDQLECENNLKILNLLSEDILDFGPEQMTSRKCRELTQTLSSEFKRILDLCIYVLEQYVNHPPAVTQSLLLIVLETIANYVKWNDPSYIFSKRLEVILLDHFWDRVEYRVACVRCYTEIFGRVCELDGPGVEAMFNCWSQFLTRLVQIPPQAWEYETKVPTNAQEFWEKLFHHIVLASTSFARNYFTSICEGQNPVASVLINKAADPYIYALETLKMLSKLTKLPGEEQFKICLEYWHHFAETTYTQLRSNSPTTRGRLDIYQPILQDLRRTFVERMARPPEVYIVYDEGTGTVERDYTPDTDEIALYNQMHATLVLLTHLGVDETEKLLLEMLSQQTDIVQRSANNADWNPTLLNRISWAIGAISGSMSVNVERSFCISVLKALLWFCNLKKGRENKAVIAATIMFVFGQYPRFLRASGPLIVTVLEKLYEFLAEPFPGVQDMACETLYKVALGCKERIASFAMPKDPLSAPHQPTQRPVYLVDVFIGKAESLARGLQTPKQIILLYHAAAICISGAAVEKQSELLAQLTTPLDQEWTSCVQQQNSMPLRDVPVEIVRRIAELLALSERIAEGTGQVYHQHLVQHYQEYLILYSLYGQYFREVAATGSIHLLNHAQPKQMRQTRRAILKLVDTFIRKAGTNRESRRDIAATYVSPLLETAYADYQQSIPELRDMEVLELATSVLSMLTEELAPEQTLTMFRSLFPPSVDMLRGSFDSFPEVRVAFAKWMCAMITMGFQQLFVQLDDTACKEFIDVLILTIQDEKPEISRIALKALVSLLKQTRNAGAEAVFKLGALGYIAMLETTLRIITDTLHTGGFRDQCALLQELVIWAEHPALSRPDSPVNREMIMKQCGMHLATSYPNLNQSQIEIFILKAFSEGQLPVDTFVQTVKDFIIQLREHGGADELFEMEKREALELAERHQKELAATVPGYAQSPVAQW